MAVALPVFFISPLAGWLCDRFGPKIPAVAGLLFSVPFLVLLRLPHASTDQTGQVAYSACGIEIAQRKCDAKASTNTSDQTHG